MKLNIGSGGQVAAGWTCLDRAFTPETIEQAAQLPTARLMEIELTAGPLPFPDESVRVAVAHHSLCMFAPDDLRALLAELVRVMEPAGMLRVSSVDFQYATRALAKRNLEWFRSLGVPAGMSAEEMFCWYFDWGGARRTVLVSPEHLGVEYLEPAGFKWEQVAFNETTAMPSICEFDAREGESWFAEARKP